MLSNEQIKDKELKMMRVASVFLKKNLSDKEIELETGIPSSTVGRYLTDPYLIELFSRIGYNGRETFMFIQEKRQEHLKLAKQKGGESFAEHNIAVKDELGKFTGSKKK